MRCHTPERSGRSEFRGCPHGRSSRQALIASQNMGPVRRSSRCIIAARIAAGMTRPMRLRGSSVGATRIFSKFCLQFANKGACVMAGSRPKRHSELEGTRSAKRQTRSFSSALDHRIGHPLLPRIHYFRRFSAVRPKRSRPPQLMRPSDYLSLLRRLVAAARHPFLQRTP